MATDFASWSTSNSYGTYSYILSYDIVSQSTTSNTSTIRVYGRIELPVYISWSRGTASVHTSSFGLSTYYSAGSHQIGSVDVTVAHNNDGTGSVYIGGSISTSYLMNGSCGGTITLPTIARNAVTNSVTGSDIEGNFSVDYTKYVSSFTYKLRISLPNIRMLETIPYNTSGATLTLSEETIEDLFTTYSTSNSFNLGFAIETWNGSTQISAGNEKIITAKILNANPTFSDFEFEDLNSDTVALTGDDQAIIKGYSNIEIRIPVSDKAVANKGATITKYRLVIGDYTEDITYSDSAMVSSSTILGATTGTYNVYAIDSRNNSTLVTKLASSEISYTPITINSSSKVERNNSGVGTSGILTYSGTYWNGDFGDEVNSIESVTYEFKPTSSQTWITGTTDITPTISNSDFSFTGIVRSNASDYTFDIATSYDFRITITDKLSTIVYVFTPLASGTPNLALAENGVGIMGAYDTSIGGPAQVGGNPLAYMPIGYIYISTNSTSPEVLFGGTWQQIAQGRTLVGIDTSDSDFNSIGKTGGSKALQEHAHEVWWGDRVFGITNSVAPTGNVWNTIGLHDASQGTALKAIATGSGHSGNLQPYLVVYMWERTA